MAPSLAAVETVRMLPGRLRITVNGLKRNPKLAQVLAQQLNNLAGVASATASYLTGRALVCYNPCVVDDKLIFKQINQIAGKSVPRVAPQSKPLIPAELMRHVPRTQLLCTATTGGVLTAILAKRLVLGVSPLASSARIFNLASLATIVAGYPILRDGLSSFTRKKQINFDLLIFVSTLILLAMRESITGLSVLWIVHLSSLFQNIMQAKSTQSIEEMLIDKQQHARRVATGRYEIIAANELAVDDIIVVQSGERVLVDGEIVAGKATVTRAAVNGEYFPVAKRVGDEIYAGARVEAGSLKVRVLSVGADTSLANLITLVERNSSLKYAGQAGDRYAARIVPWTAGIAAAIFFLTRDFHRSLAVLLAGCPAAVALARQSALGTAVARASRHGIYVKDASQLETAGKINTVLFDKTGTLTATKPEVGEILSFDSTMSGNDVLALAAAAEKGTSHPLARMLVAVAVAREVTENIRWQGRRVMMVGDGVNDSPALAASDMSVALGGGGTDWAIRSAGIVLAGDDPRKVAEVVQIGAHANAIIRQNLTLAVGLNVIGIALAVMRVITPVAAALLQNISTLGVVFNSARLMSGSRPPAQGGRVVQLKPAVAKTMNLQQFAKDNVVMFRPRSAPDNQPSSLLPLVSDGPVWHNMTPDALCDYWQTSSQMGLTLTDIRERLDQHGPNALVAKHGLSFCKLFLNQFKDFMVKVLLGAVGVSVLIGRGKDAILTLAVVLANAWLGAVQEKQAEKSMTALKQLAAPQARVIRSGQIEKINADNLVPGDIVLLEAGDRIPADARLLSSSQLEVEEASLTGETVSAKKSHIFAGGAGLALGDRKNMVYMSTSVTRGRGTAVVVATGMKTEMGKIATLIHQHDDTTTPLQRRLEELGRYLVYGSLVVSGVVFTAGVLRGQPFREMLQTSASLAVAAIPEGLAAIVIVALAMGVQRMSKRNIIVRKLSSIETLGCADVICSDKTGTLTKNEMTVRVIYAGGSTWQVTGEGYTPYGHFVHKGQKLSADSLNKNSSMRCTLMAGMLCNNAKLKQLDSAAAWSVDGDPTEGAIMVAAAKAGLMEQDINDRFQRIREIPFDSERKMMSVVCHCPERSEATLYAKGAPDVVLHTCTHYYTQGTVLPLDDEVRQQISVAHEDMTSQALRVLATAYRNVSPGVEGSPELEQQLIFCGLIGMIDPPRPEVPAAIAKCHKAGIRVVMITGDHPNTARGIARELGILKSGNTVVLGREIDQMDDDQLAAIIDNAAVFARTSPHHKLRIIKAYKECGHVVAMTGDGVNDAPAVKVADIGIAMGIMGTDVTKEAACMTLTDDNFATIIQAIEEGRSIYANIRKSIRYLLATNIGEVVMMLMAVLLGLPLPLLPLQLLWINLVGDGLPAVALVNDPPSKDIMRHQPRSAHDSVFAGGLGWKVLIRGLLISMASLGLYAWKLMLGGSLAAARTLVMVQLAISQFMHIFDCRIESQAGKVGLLSNKPLVAAVALSMTMVVRAVSVPGMRLIFGTVPLTGIEWLQAVAVASATMVLDLSIGSTVAKVAPQLDQITIVPCTPESMSSV